MNEKLEILQCLIESRVFAPSPSALAKILGYKGKMTIYRLLDGKTSLRIIDEIWEKLQELFVVTDSELTLLYNIQKSIPILQQYLFSEVDRSDSKWIDMVVSTFIKEHYNYSEKFKEEMVPVLKEVRRDNPNFFWGILLLLYIKVENIDPYQKDFKRLWIDWIDRLEIFFSEIYPENIRAKGGVLGLKATIMQEKFIPSLWMLLYSGYLLCRIYTEPDFLRILAATSSQLINCPKMSFWIIPGTEYKEGERAWVWFQDDFDTTSHGCYTVYQIQVGNDIETFHIEEMYVFRFIEEVTENKLHIMNADKTVCYYNYKYDFDEYTLHLVPCPEINVPYQLPIAMHCINAYRPCVKNEQIWCRLLDKFVKGKGWLQIQKAGGSFSQSNIYEIKDVIISRKYFSLILVESGVEKEYQLPLTEYVFFATLSPTQEIWISRHIDDGEVYIEWPSLGYAIKLSKFTQVK